MMAIRYLLIFISLSYSSVALALSYFCPQGGIVIGDTPSTVMAACGKPSSMTQQTVTHSVPILTENWTYNLNPLLEVKPTAAAILPTLVISFYNGKVSSIRKNGLLAVPLMPLTCIGNGMVRIGDDMADVTAACGTPNYITQAETPLNQTQTATVWKYNWGPYQPQIELIFIDDKLAQITNGPLGS